MTIPQPQYSRPWNPSSHDVLEEEAPESITREGERPGVRQTAATEPATREGQLKDQQAPTEKLPVPDSDKE